MPEESQAGDGNVPREGNDAPPAEAATEPAAADDAPTEGEVPDEQASEPDQTYLRRQLFAGPLPPPAIFRRYEEILPGAAERILALAENQSEHRRDLEDRALDSNIKRADRGQIFAFVLGLVGVGGAIFLIDRGNTAPGLTIFFSQVLALAGAFIYGHERGQQELQEKSTMSPEQTGKGGERSPPDAEQQELPLEGGEPPMGMPDDTDQR